jgi:hypothetical protein
MVFSRAALAEAFAADLNAQLDAEGLAGRLAQLDRESFSLSRLPNPFGAP